MQALLLNLKILSDPFKPALSRAALVFAGILIGILTVYLPLPLVGITFRNAEPVQMADGWKDTWVKNIAIAYDAQAGALPSDQLGDLNARIQNDLEAAGYGPSEIEALANAEANQGIREQLLAIQSLPDQEAANEARGKIEGGVLDYLGPILCLVGWIIGLILVGIGLSFRPLPVGKWRKGAVRRDSSTGDMAAAYQAKRAAMKAAESMDSADETTEQLGDPEVRQVSAYLLGDDHYSDSYPIEPNGGFAGECGIEISETIGDPGPKKVTAYEIFLFDQADIQTATYVLTSQYAAQEPALQTKLAQKGDAVIVAEPGKTFDINTRNLLMRVRILDMSYGEGSLPPNSFFEKLTVQLSVWVKDGVEVPGVGGSVAGLPPLPGDNIEFAPPPAMPAPQAQPQQQPMPPQPMPQQPYPPQGGQPGGPPPPQQQPYQGGQPLPPRPQQPYPPQGGQPGGPPPQQQPRPLTGNPPPQPGGPPPPQQPRPLTGNPPPPRPGGAPPPQSPPGSPPRYPSPPDEDSDSF